MWFGQVKILLNNFSSEEMSWKSARSGEQKPVRMQRRMKVKILSVVGVGESPPGVGCIYNVSFAMATAQKIRYDTIQDAILTCARKPT